MHIDIKEAKEKYGKSETTLRNIVREWRKGKHKGAIKLDNGRVLFKVSFLDDKFKAQNTNPKTNSVNLPSIDERTLAILEKQLDEKDKQIEKLQFLLAQSQENYNKLIQSPEPKKKRWFKIF
ncbi:MAG: hypothetical protein EBV32_03435 [Proteobacteria bacterium]|jgi:hypothetical protein|uniref:Uncharacterized protein n=1 Tax=Candidatus Fonsibacter lacus TaxID=2576439 RepID=A0A964XS48_9PROT|nr:hypothetical protein [Candidatus Fonsibacter lacus]NCU72183.1 hypothetical protein [Candidatus Fonsibacter lacus]